MQQGCIRAGVSLAAMLIAMPAIAQDEGNNQGGLHDIIVTAQRKAENLQDVPISVTALTSDSLTSSGISDTTELQAASPGLVTFQTANNFSPFIRGVGTNQTASGSEASVALYIDGVYQGPKPGNVMDLGAIERIEVLKGPQGTLFGRNATGGAINIVTKDPTVDPAISAEFGYGRFDEKTSRAYASGAVTDTLLAAVSFSGKWSDGYIRDVYRNKDQAPVKSLNGMLKLKWMPTDRLTATLTGGYSYLDDPTFMSAHAEPGTISTAAGLGFLAPTGPREAATSAEDAISTVKTARATLNVNADLGGIDLVSITGYVHMDAFNFFDLDSSPANILHLSTGQIGRQFSQELQLQKNDGPFRWIAGLYYLRFRDGYDKFPKPYLLQQNLPFEFRPSDLITGRVALARSAIVTTNTGSIFGQGTYDIAPTTRITAGLRYSIEKKAVKGTQYLINGTPAPGAGIELDAGSGDPFGAVQNATVDLSKTFKKLTWRLAIDHDFSDDIMGYASYTRGFKSGSLNAGIISNAQVPVNPEEIDAFEVGLKSELFDRKLRLNIAAFYYDYKDIQVSLVTAGSTSVTENAAAARLYGLDVDFVAAPTRQLTIRGGINLLNSKYKKYESAALFLPRTAATCPTGAAAQVTLDQAKAIATLPQLGGNCTYRLDASGSDLIIAPKLTANIGFDYDLPMGNSRLTLSSSLYYNDGFDTAAGGIFAHVPSYEALTASATWNGPDDRYFVRLWGRNLTNDIHPELILPLATTFQEVSSMPRSYGVTVGFKFGAR
uniref:TonB-dependent receptor n=1 Tax=Sphingobium sp. EM0848 TaxID=2743473 RepID=UPI00159CAB3C